MTDEMPSRIPVMTRAEVQARVAGLLTVCAGVAEGCTSGDEAVTQMRSLADDVLKLYFGFDGSNPAYEATARPIIDEVAAIYSGRLGTVIDAFAQAFTELARAHGQTTGDPQAVSDLVQRLALHWAAQGPPPPPVDAPSATD